MAKPGPYNYSAKNQDFGLTRIEKQLIALIAEGHSEGEIAQAMGLSETTLRLHLARLCDKLQVANKIELVLSALHHHLVSNPEKHPPVG